MLARVHERLLVDAFANARYTGAAFIKFGRAPTPRGEPSFHFSLKCQG
jgi:hypothetical protein